MFKALIKLGMMAGALAIAGPIILLGNMSGDVFDDE